MSGLKQLSGLDATFLYMETPETPMHVAGLTLYERPKALAGSFYDHFRTFFETRMHLIPIFSKKLARTILELDHPGWIEARDVNLDHHILHATLPSPGSMAQLEALVADLHAKTLDRSRPLWQFTVIEGLESGHVALYSKVHHAAVDGGAGMVITQALYDVTEVPREVPPAPPKPAPGPKPTQSERAVENLNNFLGNLMRHQLNAAVAGAQVMSTVANLLAPPPKDKSTPREPKGEGGGPSLPQVLAPRTPFNVTISTERSYAARSLSLADAKLVAKATGAKINDVVMAIAAGALRAYLLDQKALPPAPLVAFVPISLREMGNTEINNQVFGMNCPLATDIADPIARLKSIQRTSTTSKTIAGVTKDAALKDFTMLGAPVLLPGLMSLFGKSGLADVLPMAVNLVISNTPGPQFPLYCAGARVIALYPVSIPVHGVALNITVASYMGKLDFGITAGRKAVPDAGRLADLLAVSLDELKTAAANLGEAAPAQPKPAKAKAG